MRTREKLRIKGLLAALGSAAALVLAFAPLDAAAQITNSKHNLSSGSTTGSAFSGTDQICVFCHTPHGANTAVAAPLWNKAAPTSTYQTYSTGNSYSIDGGVSSVGSVSLACLSCHDGSLAIATMINQPGSGGYDANGAVMAGSWTGATGGVDTTTGKMKTSSVAFLDTDLRNDHPIGIQYCGGGLTGSGTTVSGTCNDPDFNLPVTASVGGNQVFWVDSAGGTAGTRQKTDLSLYTRSGVTGPMVECASCHDPHSTTNGTFLRVSNAASGLCLTCHIK